MTADRSIVLVGERSLLIDLASTREVHALSRWLAGSEHAGLTEDVVPASRTLFVRVSRPADLPTLARALHDASLTDGHDASSSRLLELAVTYDGEDLPSVAEATGLDAAEVIRRHADREYEVAFFGFAPGLAMLSGVPSAIAIPRRDSPRLRVGAGAVAIANAHTLVYPGGTPGGWNIIATYRGTPLWDSRAEPPNALDVGDRVVFREAR
ncbi:MAG: carboxyltransferase domain-containing protein [Aeromicrobium sp.]